MRASYVAVVIVVVGVDASLIPLNGLLGLNRRGVFVWAGSIIHSLHSYPRGSGGGVAYNTGMALSLRASLSVLLLPLLTLSSFFSLTFPPLGTNDGTVISQSLATILGSHVVQDFRVGRTDEQDHVLCNSTIDARPQAGLRNPIASGTSRHKHRDKEAENFLSVADKSGFNAAGNKKLSSDTGRSPT